MKNLLVAFSVSMVLAGCGAGSSEEPGTEESVPLGEANPVSNPYTESAIASASTDAGIMPDSESASLHVAPEFDLGSSRRKSVNVDISRLNRAPSTFLLCTVYETTEIGYKVDYNSCPVRARLLDGTYQSDVLIMNQYERVLGIVWFDQVGDAPLYKEFNLIDEPAGTAALQWF